MTAKACSYTRHKTLKFPGTLSPVNKNMGPVFRVPYFLYFQLRRQEYRRIWRRGSGILHSAQAGACQGGITEPGGVLCHHRLLPGGVQDGEPGCLLHCHDLRHYLHPLLEELYHLLIDPVDLHPEFLQCTHIKILLIL